MKNKFKMKPQNVTPILSKTIRDRRQAKNE